ncbi:hypothetical protein MKW92_036945 [Papaver armeniacum]|nr:hypothetical protein MKW92_036945 [Papaver armeniacum]
MKFGKELALQMVQEWQEAYIDYTNLKSLLKDILRFKQKNKPSQQIPTLPNGGLNRRISLYRAFSGLTRRPSNVTEEDVEDQVILVNAVQQVGSEGCYHTQFLKTSEKGGEYELVFFRRLDDEFNKVSQFYKMKVGLVLNEAQELNKQMDALIALRLKVHKPTVPFEDVMPSRDSKGNGSPVCKEMAHMEVIEEIEKSQSGTDHKPEADSTLASLDVLNHVKINVKLETPRSTIKGIFTDSKHRDLTFSTQELREVEEQLKRAFFEFYQKLKLLKSYSFLNLLAVSKIMKKYDKITSRSASKAYLKMVDNSYIGSSDEVTRLMERVEATYIKHFSNANRSKGISALKPKARPERHRTTFCLGFFSGCSVALAVGIGVIIHARNIFNHDRRGQYMENMFPLYSLFGFIVLHLIMYSANVFFWRRYRVNHPFIFGFKPGTDLGYRQVFLVGAGLAVLALAGVLSNLDMDLDPRTKSFQALTELVPLGLVTVLLLITFCPFNIMYRSSRFFILRCLLHCVLAPLYKVQALRCLEFYICYYVGGDFRQRKNSCNKSQIFQIFYLIVAVIPYWFRFIQCIRRFVEEKDKMQGYNGLKYLSTIVAVVIRTIYEQKMGTTWKIMAGASSMIAAVANTYWDLVIDWGLLQWHSNNFCLRDKLLVPHKSVYFIAMILDVLLRFAWLQSILGFREFFFFHRTAVTAIFACLEILRRGIWNFFRLENEHLNNVGNYRAFKSVPLPFNYNEDDDKDE